VTSGGMPATASGFLGGAVVYLAANLLLARRGARHRKRSGEQQPSEKEQAGSGTAIAIGALLDGIPESAAIGVSLLGGGAVGFAVVAAVFISNIPESLSSSVGMRATGRSARYILGLWTAVTVASAAAAGLGYSVLGGADPSIVAATQAFAAGAILTMLSDTMVPEAVEHAGALVGLVTAAGFICSFLLSQA